MKKCISLLLVLTMIFALCACSKKEPAAPKESAAAAEPAVVKEPAATPEPAAAMPAPAAAAAPESAPEPEPAVEAAPAPAPAVPFDPDFTFYVTDRDGTAYDEHVFAENGLTVLIVWNTFTESCIPELAVLEKLWENYRDRGLMVFGVYGFSTTSEQIESVVAQTGASYPMISFPSALIEYQSGIVPNTILVDRAGHVQTHTPDPDLLAYLGKNFDRDYAGFLAERVYAKNMSYEEWEALVLPYLQA
jgi:peroxiredoxin/predicted small lipoprotein YifL